jgi:hypothetical protein
MHNPSWEAGKYRSSVGPEEQGVREGSQLEGGNMGTGCRPTGSLQAGYCKGTGHGVEEGKQTALF